MSAWTTLAWSFVGAALDDAHPATLKAVHVRASNRIALVSFMAVCSLNVPPFCELLGGITQTASVVNRRVENATISLHQSRTLGRNKPIR